MLRNGLYIELEVAGELGFEPRFSESESDVLPLNYSPTRAAAGICADLPPCGGQAGDGPVWSGRRRAGVRSEII